MYAKQPRCWGRGGGIPLEFSIDPVQEIIQLNIHNSLGMYRHRAELIPTFATTINLMIIRHSTTPPVNPSTLLSAEHSSKIAADIYS